MLGVGAHNALAAGEDELQTMKGVGPKLAAILRTLVLALLVGYLLWALPLGIVFSGAAASTLSGRASISAADVASITS